MDSMVGFLVAILALVMAWRAGRRIKQLETRLDELTNATTDIASRDEQTADDTLHKVESRAEPTPNTVWSSGAAKSDQLTRPKHVSETPTGTVARQKLGAFMSWVSRNWIYPVAALALVMSAIFLVQYSIEAGLLTPKARIVLGLIIGAGLIIGGDLLRRANRSHDEALRNVAATFVGSGVGALFASVLAAFHLYDLLSQELTFLALAAIAVLSLALAWGHGILLAVIGILAASSAPFLLGSSERPQDLLYGYFVVVALLGFAMGGLRSWPAISVLSAIVPVMGIILIRMGGASEIWHAVALAALALAAMALPSGGFVPRAQGALACQFRPNRSPITVYTSLILLAAMVGSCLWLGSPITATAALGMLAVVFPIWTRNAPALSDQVLSPTLGMVAAIIWHGLNSGQPLPMDPEAQFTILAGLVALSATAGAVMLWRARIETGLHRDGWAIIGVLFPGAVLVALELFWHASEHVGAWPWAGLSMALAIGYSCVAVYFSKQDMGQGICVGGTAAAAFALIGFAIMLILSAAALTLALAVLLIAAALMDRRFNIPGLHWALLAGTAALAWRFVVDPGLFWLVEDASRLSKASHFDLFLTVDAVLGGSAAAWLITASMEPNRLRSWSRFSLESLFINALPVVLAVLLIRYVYSGGETLHNLGGSVLTAWSLLAWHQFRRAKQLDINRLQAVFHHGMRWLYHGLTVVMSFLLVTLLNPIGYFAEIRGVWAINNLILAYLMPALVLIWIARRQELPKFSNILNTVLGTVLAALWIALNIRFIWQGSAGMSLWSGFEQGEIYSYTVAILLAGSIYMALALKSGQQVYRRIGLLLIAIAAAKAFAFDTSGLDGLMRVGGFLALGVSLAGIAWLNSWVSKRMADDAAH